MTVILVIQEPRPRGDKIAPAIAKRLGTKLVDRRRLQQCIARRVQVTEATIRRMLEGKASLLDRWMNNARRVERRMEEEVERLTAAGGVLIASRETMPLLRRIEHVIWIHVCTSSTGPTRDGDAAQAAATRMQRWQAAPRAWLRRRPGGHACKRLANYDLVIDPQHIPLAQCVEQVRWLAKSARCRSTPASPLSFAEPSQEKQCSPEAHGVPEPESNLIAGEVMVGSRRVILLGVGDNEQAIAMIERHWRGSGSATAPRPCALPPAGLFG